MQVLSARPQLDVRHDQHFCNRGTHVRPKDRRYSWLLALRVGDYLLAPETLSHLINCSGGYAGGQAEYVRIPLADHNLLKIPDSIPDEKASFVWRLLLLRVLTVRQALFLSDIIPTSYHAVQCAEVKQGFVTSFPSFRKLSLMCTTGTPSLSGHVLLFASEAGLKYLHVFLQGLGPIGLLAARWAQLAGARRVVGIDTVPARLDLARHRLGIEVVDYNAVSSVPDELLKLEPYGFDRCIGA